MHNDRETAENRNEEEPTEHTRSYLLESNVSPKAFVKWDIEESYFTSLHLRRRRLMNRSCLVTKEKKKSQNVRRSWWIYRPERRRRNGQHLESDGASTTAYEKHTCTGAIFREKPSEFPRLKAEIYIILCIFLWFMAKSCQSPDANDNVLILG